MSNKTDGDPERKGGAYAPKGRKRGKAAPALPVDRKRPVGGWPSSVKTERHGHYGTIARARREKARAKAAA